MPCPMPAIAAPPPSPRRPAIGVTDRSRLCRGGFWSSSAPAQPLLVEGPLDRRPVQRELADGGVREVIPRATPGDARIGPKAANTDRLPPARHGPSRRLWRAVNEHQ